MEKILDITSPGAVEVLEYDDERFPVREYIDNYDHFPDHKFPAHSHPEFELHLVLRGSIEFHIEHDTCRLEAGQSLYIAPNSIHTAHALTDGANSYNVIVLPDLLTRLLGAINRVQDSLPLSSGRPTFFVLDSPDRREDYYIAESLRTMYYSNTTSQTELFILANLLSIWRNLLLIFPKEDLSYEDPHSALQSERMKIMLDFIHQQFTQPITITDIAQAANVSKSECFRCFSTLSETTPLEYLNNYRLMQACRLLLDTKDSMTDICFQTGFNNTSYFAKKFRTQYGMTPKEYRASHLTGF